MERLKKRCLAASFSGHFLLLLALLVSPLLISKSTVPAEMPVITYIPSNILEGIIGTGGEAGGGASSKDNRLPKGPSAPKPQESTQNSIVPPVVEEKVEPPRTPPAQKNPSKVPKAKKEPEPEADAEVRPPPKSVIPDLTPVHKKKAARSREKESPLEKETSASSKSTIQPNLKRARIETDDGVGKAKRDAELAEASRRAGEERGALINSVAERIGSGTGAGLSIQGLSGIGAGIGGDGYASYGQVLMAVYQKAWMEPSEVEGSQHVVKTEVVVGRDGRVISSRIVGHCRSEVVNKTVQRALDRVRFIAPFAPGMNDLTKTFLLDFDLQAKRNAG